MNAIDLLRRAAGLAERSAVVPFGDSSIPAWSSLSATSSGVLITYEKAMGLSVAADAVRQPSVLAAGLPLDVYDVSPDRKQRSLSRGKWQNALLDQPDSTRSGFDFWSDLHTSVNGKSNAYALKLRDGGRVVELVLLKPDGMECLVDKRTRQRTYRQHRAEGGVVEIPGADLIHVRGWDECGAPIARTPGERHRDAIGKSYARGAFEEKFLSNDARPGVIIKMPEKVTRSQAAEFLDLFEQRHRNNPGRPNVIGGGGDIVSLPISMRDAQMIQAEEFAVTDLARIYDWSADLLGRETGRPFVEVMAWAVRLHLMPRLQRVEAALGDDPDLFGAGSKFRPYHDVSELLRGDALTMATIFHQLKQVGMITANEGRIPLGWPAMDGGDELQATPVGGAPNADTPAPATPPPGE